MRKSLLPGSAGPQAHPGPAKPAGQKPLLSPELLEELIYLALKRGGDFADVYVQHRVLTQINVQERMIRSAQKAVDHGVGIRVVSGEKTGYAYVDDFSPPKLRDAARIASYIANTPGRAVQLAPLAAAPVLLRYQIELDPTEAGLPDKIALVRRADEAAYAYDGRIVQVMVGFVDEVRTNTIANSQGLMATYREIMCRLHVESIARQENELQRGFYGGGGRVGLEHFQAHPPEAIAREASRQAIVQLGAAPAPAGEIPVVIGNAWGGVLLHEAVGHGLEADFNRKKTSLYSGRLGERVASELVSIVDDGTLAHHRGTIHVDDEGRPAERKLLIANGLLAGYMFDELNARLMKACSTGSGRRQSYRHIPMPRMTNTFMLAGESTPDEIIASVDRGLYAKQFSGGQVDISNGNFTFSVTEGYLIENGRITTPVKGATLIGNGPDILTKVTMVGHNLELDPGIGTCGKDGQMVPVGVGMPMIKVARMTVGGTEGLAAPPMV